MSNQTQNTYLTFYPIPHPVFSTRNCVKDNDGWWRIVPSKKRRTKKFTSTNLDTSNFS